jgi:ABC-type dipeptide/oligopeptide/nickel transport system ATPase component
MPPEAILSASRSEPLLRVEDLCVSYGARGQPPKMALSGISFQIRSGESVGIIGESGSGKSTLALSILRLLPANAMIVRGRLFFRGTEMLHSSERILRRIRGSLISMVFQHPGMALNPFMRVRSQVAEVIRAHRREPRSRSLKAADDVLKRVFSGEPGDLFDAYPHQLSGGQRQRVCIAQAFACNPELVIADEPTASLDGVSQAGVLEMFREFQTHSSTSLIVITQNPAVLPGLVDRVLVMRGGELVEEGAAREVLYSPRKAYTAELLQSVQPGAA